MLAFIIAIGRPMLHWVDTFITVTVHVYWPSGMSGENKYNPNKNNNK